MTDDQTEYEDDFPSKSQVKREMHELQKLGELLLGLNASQLSQIPLTEELSQAIEESHRITQREARRRHLQLMGKLMRKADVEAIEKAVKRFDASADEHARWFHQMERWRTRFLANDNTAVTEYVQQYPQTNVQHLRQLIRQAIKEQKKNDQLAANQNMANISKQAYKKLFQYIRSTIEDLE